MKKTLLMAIISLGAAAFAESPSTIIPSPVAVESKPFSIPLSQTISKAKDSFFYVRFAAGEHSLIRAASPIPGLGLGYRLLAGNGAADISLSGIGISEGKNSRFFWTVPKVSYCRYLQPDASKSFYAGGGMAWGGVREDRRGKKDEDGYYHHEVNRFIGLIPSATLGYEFVRKTSFLGFTELTVSQPLLAVHKQGRFPGPIAELSLGVGF